MHHTSGTILNCFSGGIGKIRNIHNLPAAPAQLLPYKQLIFTGIILTRTIEVIKKKNLFLLVIFFTFSALAQESTLISGDIESGGFGAPVIKVTNINGENAVIAGGRGGWIINHSFVLGGGGYGLVTDVNAKVKDLNHQYVEMGYGGLEIEYIASSNDMIHLSMGLLVGGGGIG